MRQDVDKFRPRLLKILYGKGPKTNAGGIRTKPTTRKTNIMSETIATIGPNKWSSARTSGEEKPVFTYELWPGVPAVVNGVTYPLQHS
jgi:hypothetical protein